MLRNTVSYQRPCITQKDDSLYKSMNKKLYNTNDQRSVSLKFITLLVFGEGYGRNANISCLNLRS
jgi:hypothetical protein